MVPTPLDRKQLLFSLRTVVLRPIPSRKGLQCLPEMLTLRRCQWDNFLPPTNLPFAGKIEMPDTYPSSTFFFGQPLRFAEKQQNLAQP